MSTPTPINSSGGNLFSNVCRIRVGDPGSQSLAILNWSLAHEVFHCFQFDLAPSAWDHDAPWIIEGTAEWASTTVDPVEASDAALREYLASPQQNLFTRAYDATGF